MAGRWRERYSLSVYLLLQRERSSAGISKALSFLGTSKNICPDLPRSRRIIPRRVGGSWPFTKPHVRCGR
jgi:hypothetical protein